MDQVTEITRRGGVATVKMLSGEVLKIPSTVYLERRLRVGEKTDPEAYRLFIRQRGYPHALEMAVKYLALRERSEKEVSGRLRRACYDEATVARVMETLSLHDLVSDGRFAGEWVESRAKKYGRGRIAQELRRKGVGEEEARQALEELPEEEEYARARDQAMKMKRKFQNDPQKITRALVRRGYGWQMARRAAEEAVRSAAPGAGW